MVAFALFDFVRSSEGSLEKAQAVAGELIGGALAEFQQLQKLEAKLKPFDNPRADRQTAALFLGSYEAWAREAQGVLERLKRLGDQAATIKGAAELERAYGSTRAMLSISLDDMIKSDEDIKAGRLISIEEVRREVRLRANRKGKRRVERLGGVPPRRNAR
jgi:hypothetical protein